MLGGHEKAGDMEDPLALPSVQWRGGEDSYPILQCWVRNKRATCHSISFGSRMIVLHFPMKFPRWALSCCSRAGQPVGLCSWLEKPVPPGEKYKHFLKSSLFPLNKNVESLNASLNGLGEMVCVWFIWVSLSSCSQSDAFLLAANKRDRNIQKELVIKGFSIWDGRWESGHLHQLPVQLCWARPAALLPRPLQLDPLLEGLQEWGWKSAPPDSQHLGLGFRRRWRARGCYTGLNLAWVPPCRRGPQACWAAHEGPVLDYICFDAPAALVLWGQ